MTYTLVVLLIRAKLSPWLSASVVSISSGSAAVWTARSAWCGEDRFSYGWNTRAWMYASASGAQPGLTSNSVYGDKSSSVAFGFS